MNNDVLFEILLHLPVRSLLRFIRVCKFWYYVIDSPHFKYQHTLRLNNKKDEEVYLHFSLRHDDYIYRLFGKKVSLNLLDNGKSLKFPHDSCIDLRVVSGAVKGLFCLSSPTFDTVICNPFLGQSKILPLSPYSCTYSQRNNIAHQVVGLGFHEDYKVVELLSSLKPGCLHASLYLAKTNSWRKLDLDPNLVIKKPIKSVCKNGSFAYWEGLNTSGKEIILSFDMKNEVFRTITISCDSVLGHSTILAKGECSFVFFVRERCKLKIYELSCEGSELIWNNVNNVELPSLSVAPPIRRIDDIPTRKANDIPIRRNYDIPTRKVDDIPIRRNDDIPISKVNDIPIRRVNDISIWRNDNCVVLRDLHIRNDYGPIGMPYNSGCQSSKVILYDYCARKLIGCFKIHESSNTTTTDDIIEYEGSFLSP
ncbi:putative F-box/kelch-repeat protein At1g13200 [Salvia hispanica]|uniref:putative F-box/kelch-repeat protein At1g13200 n=1 Tax=Salvia hispanica TaxID=49212 RepID=UPI002009C673|nr:putative F-box/kelch-repeat protein At1g13200 [Salvia hispanica]